MKRQESQSLLDGDLCEEKPERERDVIAVVNYNSAPRLNVYNSRHPAAIVWRQKTISMKFISIAVNISSHLFIFFFFLPSNPIQEVVSQSFRIEYL